MLTHRYSISHRIMAILLASTAVASAGETPEIIWRDAGQSSNGDIAYSRDGKLVATAPSNSGEIRVSLAADGSLVTAIDGSSFATDAVVFSPDDRFIAATFRQLVLIDIVAGGVRMWSLDNGEMRFETPLHAVALTLDASPDGSMLASGHTDGAILLWSTADGTLLDEIDTGTGVGAVAFSPDGRLIAAGGDDHAVRLYDVKTRLPTGTLLGHTDRVNDVAFSADSQFLGSASGDPPFDNPDDFTVRLWRVADGALLHTLTGYTTVALDVAFSPDGDVLVASGVDGRYPENMGVIRAWETASGELIITIREQLSVPIASFDLSPDGATFAYGSPQGATVARLNLGEVIEGDVDGDGVVDVTDLLVLLASWGPCNACPADIDGSGSVDVTDLLTLLGNWG